MLIESTNYICAEKTPAWQCFKNVMCSNPNGNYMFKVNSKNIRYQVCSKLTMKRRRSGVFNVVNFDRISHLVLVFLLLTLSR